MSHPLDNPIWRALTTSQAHFAETLGMARRFPPDVTPLGAFSAPSPSAYESLARLLAKGETIVVLLLESEECPSGWEMVEAAPLLQMIHEDRSLRAAPCEMVKLTEADVPEMLALTALTKPGPFSQRTRELGLYLGIRREGRLVAMTGERLRVPGYAEVSAVCTHPDHSGQGHAGALITAIVERMYRRGEQPFLHVRLENTRAIEVYRRLGFTDRRVLQMAVLRKSAQ
jgi:predicted GNAT family acetyltransferase